MEVRHLRAFIALAEELNFTRAAERLHMAQPPLSRLLSQLEHDLGVRLLNRNTRMVELTPAGAVLYDQARKVLTLLDETRNEVIKSARGESGIIRAGFSGATTYSFLPLLVRHFRSTYPDIHIDPLSEMLTASQIEALLQGDIDIGFLGRKVEHPFLKSEPLVEIPLILAISDDKCLELTHKTGKIKLSDLASEDFISYPSGEASVLYELTQRVCRQVGFRPRIAFTVSVTSTLISYVAGGLGVAIVPATVSKVAVEGVRYMEIIDDIPDLQLHTAWRTDNRSEVLQTFRTEAAAVIRRWASMSQNIS